MNKGNCPTCGRFLHDNVASLIHGLRRAGPLPPGRESRRIELREKVWAELGGQVPPIIAEIATDFVNACVLRDQLDDYLQDVGALTQRGSRRAAMDLYLATSARIERLSVPLCAFKDAPKPRHTATPLPGLALMPTSALEHARDLLSRLKAGEVLSDFEQGRLSVLSAAMAGAVALPPDTATPAVVPPENSTNDPTTDAMTLNEEPEKAVDAAPPAPAPPAPLTGADLDAELKKRDRALWLRVSNSDEAKAERSAIATKIMFHQVGKPHPWDY